MRVVDERYSIAIVYAYFFSLGVLFVKQRAYADLRSLDLFMMWYIQNPKTPMLICYR
jgi:hypothetical protein